MELRQYRPEDVHEIITLFYDTVHTVNAADYTSEQRDAWAPKEQDAAAWNRKLSEHDTLLAWERGRIVGFGDMDETGYLDHLYVHRDCQRQGIAAAISEALEERAARKGLRIIVVHASITARPFFEARGYRMVREQSVKRRGQTLTNYVMEKRLGDTKEEFRQIAEDRFYIRGEETVLSILSEHGIRIPAACGGRGSCGKCRVIAEGEAAVSGQDRAVFREDELAAGDRLACRLMPREGLVIRIPQVSRCAEEAYTSVDSFLPGEEGDGHGPKSGESPVPGMSHPLRGVSAAVDIGTTTLAFAGAADDTGEVLASMSAMNPQRKYGADVMSRITAAAQGAAEQMKKEILRAVGDGIREICKGETSERDAGERSERCEGEISKQCEGEVRKQGTGGNTSDEGREERVLTRIAIAGNTVMLHLLRGYEVSGLGRTPFRAVTLEEEHLTAAELFGEERPDWIPEDTPVSLLPGIGAFVGADITAGLYCCDFFTREDRAFLLDLGTNGEMALLADGVLYTASAAAGPAFEGGNISCGIGSVPGAVSDVSLSKDAQGRLTSRVSVIGGKRPAGLCGTGLIALVSEMKRMGLMDGTGLLKEQYWKDGFVFAEGVAGEEEGGRAGEGTGSRAGALSLTQKDIREFQLAKGAIRAGISILLAKAGLEAEEMDQVYLAGGFGFFLDTGKAIDVGLLPPGWRGKIAAVGNSCIGGLIRYLNEGGETLKRLFDRSRIVELNLAGQPDFYEQYMRAMAFEEEM